MKTMKTSQLIDVALDWAVAECEGLLGFGYQDDMGLLRITLSTGETEYFMPTLNWSHGGPIIGREEIGVTKPVGSLAWVATMQYQNDDYDIIYQGEEQGTTPLIAAMRCYVASKMGDEVQLPEELQ